MQAKLRCAYRLQLFDLPVSIFCEKINQEKAGIEMFYKEAISLIFIPFFIYLFIYFIIVEILNLSFILSEKESSLKTFQLLGHNVPRLKAVVPFFFTYFFSTIP